MSLTGNRWGGQYPSKPLSTGDKIWLWLGASAIAGVVGYPVYRVLHWVFW